MKLRRPIGMAIQLLAAVPSIIYGMWGFFVVVPLIAAYLQPPMIALFGGIPLVGAPVQGAAAWAPGCSPPGSSSP